MRFDGRDSLYATINSLALTQRLPQQQARGELQLVVSLRYSMAATELKGVMPRKGRRFEDLVSLIERALKDSGIKVQSPDHIRGLLSKKVREVDVTLRGKVGSTDLLVTFECRDRSARQGVEWIEQVASKRDDVGAHLAVAVSASGFTKAAQQLAAAKGVVLRRLEAVTGDDVRSLFRVDEAAFIAPRLVIERFHFFAPAGSSGDARQIGARVREGITPTTPIVGFGDDAPSVSWQQLESGLQSRIRDEIGDSIDDHLPEEIPPFGMFVRIMEQEGSAPCVLNGSNPYVETFSGRQRFGAVFADYRFWVQVGRMRIEKWRSYAGDERLAIVGSGELNFGITQRADLVMRDGSSTEAVVRVHAPDPEDESG